VEVSYEMTPREVERWWHAHSRVKPIPSGVRAQRGPLRSGRQRVAPAAHVQAKIRRPPNDALKLTKEPPSIK